MTELERVQPRNTLQGKIAYARELANSGLLPASYRKQPANILYAVEYGEMLGLSPMAAITGIHVIEGKPTASAGLISALVRRAGHKLRVTGDDSKALAEIIRADDPDFTFRSEWTMGRAQQAGLTGKKVWKQYPAAMLKARAISEVARDACEEALSGVHYTPEELGAEVGEDGEVITAQQETSAPNNAAQADDTFYVREAPGQETDQAWLQDITGRIGSASDKDGLRKLWAEVREKVRGGVCTMADGTQLQNLIKARIEHVDKPETSEIVDAEIVEDAVTDQAWADRFEQRVDKATTVGEVRGLRSELEMVIADRRIAEHDVDTYRRLVNNRETELTQPGEAAA